MKTYLFHGLLRASGVWSSEVLVRPEKTRATAMPSTRPMLDSADPSRGVEKGLHVDIVPWRLGGVVGWVMGGG